MSHLLRIIMIHGHLEGIVELDLNGHTNICGTNASGKTTLQRLIPVFYGERPNNVVPKTRKKFDQYYLPNSNSYLLYEYRREAGNVCHVALTRRKDEGVSYRFVNSPYRPELYLTSTPQGEIQAHSYSAFTTHLRQNKIEHSSRIDTISEYRSIIQNDFSLLTGSLPRTESNRLRQTALRYSLAESPHRLRHMEKLVSAVHAKEGKMDTLKTMLAAIFEDEGVALPSTRIKSTQVREWVQQVRQSRRLQNLQNEMLGLNKQAQTLNSIEQSLWQLQPLLVADNSQLQRSCADQEASIKQAQRDLAKHEESHLEQRAKLDSKLSKTTSDLKQTATDLESIEQRYTEFSEKDMPSLEHAVQQLPNWREQRDELATHLQLLREEEGDSRQRFESRKLQLLEQLDAFVTNNTNQQQLLRDKEQAKRQEQEQQKNQLEKDQQLAVQKLQAELQTQHNQVYQQQAEVKAQLGVSLLNAEEQLAAAAEQARLEDIQLQLNQQNELVDHLREAYQQAKQIQNAHLDEVNRQRKHIRQIEHSYQQLKQQQTPRSGSLRHFLHEHIPTWQHSVGKVIREDLLERTDLTPLLTTTELAQQHGLASQQQQLFNIRLDLAAIELPAYAQDAQALEDAIQHTLAELHEAEQQFITLENEQKVHNSHSQQQQELLQQAQQTRDRYRSDLEYAQESRQRLIEQHQQLEQQRKQELLNQQQQLTEQLEQLKAQQHKRLTDEHAAFRNLLLEYQAGWQSDLQLIHEQIRQHTSSIDAKRHETEQQVLELQTALARELRDSGIDPEKLKAIELRLTAINQQIHDTQARRDELDAYQRFLRVDWQIRKPQLLAQEHQLKQLQTTLSEQLQSLQHTFLEQQKNALLTIKNDEQQLAGQRKLLEQIRPLLQQLELYPAPAQCPSSTEHNTGDCAERIERTRRALHDMQNLSSRLNNSLQLFERELFKDASADFTDTWRRQQQRLGLEPSPQALLTAYQEMLQVLENQQLNLLATGRNYGADLQAFFTVFSDLNRRINAQSRRLSEEVSEEFVLEGISKSEVKIQSSIDELGFWEPLKRFAKLYAEWEQDADRLPNDNYLDALSDVAYLLRSDQQFTFESLLRLELHLNEGGTDLIIRNDRQLLESSSHGMAYLILCKYLLAFTRLLRGTAQVTIHWPIDEIGTLAYHNVEKLFKACDNNNIFIVGAFPNPESDVLTLFKHRYLIERDSRKGAYSQLKRIEPKVSRLTQRLQERRAETAQ